MAAQLLVVLLVASIASYTSAEEDDFSSVVLNNRLIEEGIYDPSYRCRVNPKECLTLNRLDNLYSHFEENYQNIVKVTTIGKSGVRGTPIKAVQISNKVHWKRQTLKPMVLLAANMRGSDTISYAMMVLLMQSLVYNSHKFRVAKMLRDIDIWIIPTLNPDGLQHSVEGRCDSANDKLQKKPSENIMEFIKGKPFVLSGILQGGALVASYPLDSSKNSTRDNEVFQKLAGDYAKNNPMMAQGSACNESFKRGITGGYPWGNKHGGMQDANYIVSNCFDISFYIGCCDSPPSNSLPLYWAANLESMLVFIESALQGVYGLVMDNLGNIVKDAVVKIKGGREIKVTEGGEYWSLLVPGVYEITASAPRLKAKTLIIDTQTEISYARRYFYLSSEQSSSKVKMQDLGPVLGNVFGHILDPVRNGSNTVTVVKVVREGKEIKTRAEVKEIKTRVNGEYFIQLNFGRYTLTAMATGYFTETRTVDVTKDVPDVEVDFELRRFGVRGIVENERGVPIKRAVLRVKTVGTESNQHFDQYTLEYGDFWLPLEVGQTYFVTARASGYHAQTKEVELTDQTPYIGLNFVLSRASVLNKLPCFRSPTRP